MKMDIAYFRVSKEEKGRQDLDTQIRKVFEKFNLPQETKVYKERGSAYDLNKFHKRKEFITLLEELFGAKDTSIYDLFIRNVERKDINLYVWDYSRLMRNLEFNLLFSIMCCFHNIKIFSYKDGKFEIQDEATPTLKLGSYMLLMVQAYSGEEYSYNISTNIKKVVKQENGVTVSSKGNKWGRGKKDLHDNKVEISTEKENEMYEDVIELLKKGITQREISRIVSEKHNVYIAPSTVNKINKTTDIAK